eukprot:TRINITY_DN7331_c0_g1_i1.p1 TRINITY_DN7331_c0_g1~~TRINITY_DN7331_c0_g1_i1.p1  ORF type:complete len:340 (-),score=59.49 TRINITY_DN7331_c0_g1_i1:132-1151(-)
MTSAAQPLSNHSNHAPSGQAVTGPSVPIGENMAYPIGQSIPRVQTGPSQSNVMPSALQASMQSAHDAGKVRLQQLQAILNSFEVSIAEANDLVALEDYEIVMIVDDSGSMTLPAAPPAQRTLGQVNRSRWEELKDTVSLVVDLGACFDVSGLDLFFLNKGILPGVKSSKDPRLLQYFNSGPERGTPLTATLRKVVDMCGGEKPVLLFIFTDGEPSEGKKAFERELKRVVKKQSTPHTFRVQIMACTADEDAVGYLNDIDKQFSEIDVTDDYYSEMQEVLKKARTRNRFTRGDWCMKAMLGPVNAKFDAWDETPKNGCKQNISDSDSDIETPLRCVCGFF